MKVWQCFLLVGAFSVSNVQAADLARVAMEKELSGDNSGRSQVLETAPATEMTDQLHWLRGEIRVGEEWLPYRRVVDHGDRWAELHRYREERAKKGDGIDDQFFLADGCRQHKLFDEERAHLHAVLVKDGDNEEARQRLGDRKIDGVWVTAEEASAVQRMIESNKKAFLKWGKTLERHIQGLSDRSPKRRASAHQALSEIRDPNAIPVMEELLGRGPEPQQLEYLAWVRNLNCWKASASIARLATASESAAVRVKATTELKSRRLEEYVPTILGTMTTPISIQSTTQQYGNWVVYSQHAVSESQNRQFDYHYLARFSPQFVRIGRSSTVRNGKVTVSQDPRFANARDGERLFAVLSEQSNAELGDRNREIDVWNERCQRVLSESTGVAGMSEPQEWWAWWEDDQGYNIKSKEQVFSQYQEQWYIGRRRGPMRRPGRAAPFMPSIFFSQSCFAAATPVMTEFGSKSIESIVRGDRVLSQDIETGELSFRPVFHTTVRTSPGSAVVKFGDEQLVCTPCHPFWVNGSGWRMARELAPGDRFHSINGAVEVTGVDVGEKVEVFNLVVGDFHTYFVGKNSVLTHDVTVRQPTDMALPGFAMETTAAVGASK